MTLTARESVSKHKDIQEYHWLICQLRDTPTVKRLATSSTKTHRIVRTVPISIQRKGLPRRRGDCSRRPRSDATQQLEHHLVFWIPLMKSRRRERTEF